MEIMEMITIKSMKFPSINIKKHSRNHVSEKLEPSAKTIRQTVSMKSQNLDATKTIGKTVSMKCQNVL